MKHSQTLITWCAESNFVKFFKPPSAVWIHLLELHHLAILHKINEVTESYNDLNWKRPLRVIQFNLHAVSRDIFSLIKYVSEEKKTILLFH